MRTLKTFIFLSLIGFANAQAPEGINYQAVIRDNAGNLLQNSLVGIKISILQSSPIGASVYDEAFTPTSNAFGLVNFVIGEGIIISGNFSTIDWGNGPYYLQIAADETGGTNYAILGTQQLVSVPYALYAKNAGNTNNSLYQGVKIGFESTTTWVCPAGINEVSVEVWGGGGGKGGNASSAIIDLAGDTLFAVGIGGTGGLGGYNKQTLSVTPGNTYTITVGLGGVFGANNANYNYSGAYLCGGNGTDGQASSFNGVLNAPGGTGGGYGCAQYPNTIPGLNGVNGTVINYPSLPPVPIRPYIPSWYLNSIPGCCANQGGKGLVVISY